MKTPAQKWAWKRFQLLGFLTGTQNRVRQLSYEWPEYRVRFYEIHRQLSSILRDIKERKSYEGR